MATVVVDLPHMMGEELEISEWLAVSTAFDFEGGGAKENIGIVWQLTPRVFREEAQGEVALEAKMLAKRHVIGLKEGKQPKKEALRSSKVKVGGNEKANNPRSSSTESLVLPLREVAVCKVPQKNSGALVSTF